MYLCVGHRLRLRRNVLGEALKKGAHVILENGLPLGRYSHGGVDQEHDRRAACGYAISRH